MNVEQVRVKIYADNSISNGISESAVVQDELLPVFHRWIREHRLGDRLLIDVADYRHVRHGPGVMLIADEAHYGLDDGAGRRGLRYTRKRDIPGPASEKIASALDATLQAAIALEEEPTLAGRLTFRGDRLRIEIASRLHGPNTPQARAELTPELTVVLDARFGDDGYDLKWRKESRGLLGVDVTARTATTATELLGRDA